MTRLGKNNHHTNQNRSPEMARAIPSTKHHLGGLVTGFVAIIWREGIQPKTEPFWKLPTDSCQNASFANLCHPLPYLFSHANPPNVHLEKCPLPSWGSPRSWSSNPTHPGVAATSMAKLLVHLTLDGPSHGLRTVSVISPIPLLLASLLKNQPKKTWHGWIVIKTWVVFFQRQQIGYIELRCQDTRV